MDDNDNFCGFRTVMNDLSSKAFHKRAAAIKVLHRRMLAGCWLSRLALEYILDHDPNYAIRNRVALIFKRSSFEPRAGLWEKHICF